MLQFREKVASIKKGKWYTYVGLYRCDCGNSLCATIKDVKAGKIVRCKTCQQTRRVTHGRTKSREYNSWSNMRQRCNNPKATYYPNYGGRGISICQRWDKFENFLADMGDRPKSQSLDRINNDGNYQPDNCRWATRTQQNLNRR